MEFQIIQNELLEIYKKKNTDYGNSYKQFGLIGILTRLQDKINRCLTISKNKIKLVEDEDLNDTLKDLSNYCILALIENQYVK